MKRHQFALTAIALTALGVGSLSANAEPIRRTGLAVANCIKTKPCSEALRRQLREWRDGIVRRTEVAAEFANDTAKAVQDAIDAAKESYSRSAKVRRVDQIHALHDEARSRQK